IEATAQISTDRHLGPHTLSHRAFHQFIERRNGTSRLDCALAITWIVVSPRTQASLGPGVTTTRLDLAHIAKCRAWSAGCPETENLIQSMQIRLSIYLAGREERLDFRSEIEVAVDDRDEQRANPEP